MAQVVVEMSGDESRLWKSYQKIIEQSKKLDDSTQRNKQSHADAFGASAISQLSTYAAGLVSIHAVLGLIKRTFSDIQQTANEMAAKHKQDFMGLGVLAQLAESVPGLQMPDLVRQAKLSYAQGATATLGEAGKLQFGITSAQMDRYRSDIAELQASGVVTDAEAFVNAASAMEASMGQEETGGFRRLISKAFGASKGAPAYAQDIMQSGAKSGPQARALGMSDEEVLAAVATLADPAGSAAEAATLLESFLKQVEKEGIARKKLEPNRSLIEYVRDIAALEAKGRGVRSVLGNRQEAITAYRLLRDNDAIYQENMANVVSADQTDAFGRKVGMFKSIPELVSSRAARVATARKELGSDAGIYANLAEAVQQDTLMRIRERAGPVAASLAKGFSYMERLMFGNRAYVQDYGPDASPDIRQLVDETLQAMRALRGAAQKLEGASESPRQRAAIAVQPE